MSSIIKKEFNGHTFYFHQTPTIGALINEIFSDNYHILQSGIEIRPADVILDLGANEGVFSILMAKLFPDAHVIALEPVSRTYKQMIANISLNHLPNVMTLQLGVGNSRREDAITIDDTFSGGSSVYMTPYPGSHIESIKVMSLDELFKILNFNRCRVMKIDVEGMEHETLLQTSVLPKVDYVVAEIHINRRLQEKGYSVEKLADHIRSLTSMPYYERCYMSE